MFPTRDVNGHLRFHTRHRFPRGERSDRSGDSGLLSTGVARDILVFLLPCIHLPLALSSSQRLADLSVSPRHRILWVRRLKIRDMWAIGRRGDASKSPVVTWFVIVACARRSSLNPFRFFADPADNTRKPRSWRVFAVAGGFAAAAFPLPRRASLDLVAWTEINCSANR